MKTCEICGVVSDGVYGKSGIRKIDLCSKCRWLMRKYGEVPDRTLRTPNEFIIHDDYAEIVTYNREKSESYKIKIDIEDIPKVNTYKWCVSRSADGYLNANSRINGKTSSLLSVILGLSNLPVFVNKDTLDCRKRNVKEGTLSNVMQNAKRSKANTSGHKGVSWAKHANKWNAYIAVNYKRIHLGLFIDIDDAIAARKEAEEKYFGDFAYDASRDVTIAN